MLVSTVLSAVPRAGRILRRPLKVACFVFICIFILFLLSGFNLEGNMDVDLDLESGKKTQLNHDSAELEWLAAVETEQRAIKQLSFVKAVTFQYGEVANACRVQDAVLP